MTARNVRAVKQAAAGRWRDILPALTGIDAALLDGRHHPCPRCGGKDRFRAIDLEAGALLCNQCFRTGNGDGLAAIQWLSGCDFNTARKRLADYLRIGNGNGKPQAKPRIVATYGYRDEAGKLVFQVVRYLPKDFRQRRPDGKGGWTWSVKGCPVVPYRLPEVLAADPAAIAFVPEGEKDCDRLASIGLVATCNAGGSGKWRAEHAAYLAGRHVVLLPDNDDDGRKHAEQVGQSLAGLAASIKVLALPALADKGDVSDWIDAGGTAEELLRMADAAPLWQPATVIAVAPRPSIALYRPFPVALLPEVLREFVIGVSRAIGCDPSYVALPALSATGAAIGNSRRLKLANTWHVPPTLWACSLGRSGAKKTPPYELAVAPLKALQAAASRAHNEAMAAHEVAMLKYDRALAAWKKSKRTSELPAKPTTPAEKQYVVSDTTIEALASVLAANPRGVLLARDELMGWIGSFDRYAAAKGGDSGHWLSCFAGGAMIVDRKTGTARKISIPSALVGVAGTTQPETYERSMGERHRDSGLAARLLLAWPPHPAAAWTDNDVDAATLHRYAALVAHLAAVEFETGDDGEPRPRLVRLSSDALARWKDWYLAHNAEAPAAVSTEAAASWAKMEQYAARLALVVHMVRWATDQLTASGRPRGDPDTVDAASMDTGIALAIWFRAEAQRIIRALRESSAERDRRDIAEWIAARGGRVTARKLQQGRRSITTAAEAESTLDDLARHGWGRWATAEHGGGPGRPTREFVLAEALTVYAIPPDHGTNGKSVDVDAMRARKNDP